MSIKKRSWKLKKRYFLAVGAMCLMIVLYNALGGVEILLSYPKQYELVGHGRVSHPGVEFIRVPHGVQQVEFRKGGVSYFVLIDVPRADLVYLSLEEKDLIRPLKARPEGSN